MAQMKSAAPAPGADSVLLSETTEGDYIVRRYMVRSSGDADFTMHYRISLATLDTSLGGNPKQLGDLNAFLSGLVGDTLRKVQSVAITGYSSPDGPVQLNEKLAAQRAQDFMAYANGKYGLSKRYTVKVNSVAEDWTMCRTLVAQSQIPDRTAVLQIIDGAQTPEQKELALEKLPAAWNYMKANILPPLRRVEVMIAYADGNIVEQRTLKPKPDREARRPRGEEDRAAECPCGREDGPKGGQGRQEGRQGDAEERKGPRKDVALRPCVPPLRPCVPPLRTGGREPVPQRAAADEERVLR